MFLVAYAFLITGLQIVPVINCSCGHVSMLLLCMEWPLMYALWLAACCFLGIESLHDTEWLPLRYVNDK